MNSHTVEKIGGTSIARKSAIDNVLIGGRADSQLYQRIFVLSAYAGITNQLIEHKKTGAPGVFALFSSAESDWAWNHALSEVAASMHEINADMFDEDADRSTADQFVRERIEGVRSCLLDLQRLCSYGHFSLAEHLERVKEMLASIGEAQSAYCTTLLLQRRGVNARFVDLTGWRDASEPTLDERIRSVFSSVDLRQELPIVTGYANCKTGLMREFGRGYTEVTFSRLAVLTEAREAIIHKEFHLSTADPNLVGEDNVRTIGRTNYDVADQLSNLGMEAVHPSAAKGLRQAEIPLRVKNTFDPQDSGTVIRGDYVSDQPRVEMVTGMKGVYAIEFFEQDMVGVKGYDAAILEALKEHEVRVLTKSSNANTIVHYLSGSRDAIKRVMNDLQKRFQSASISMRRVAIVSVIGSDLRLEGLTSSAVAALAGAGVHILGLHQLLRNVDILFILDESDYEAAIIALHRRLIEHEPAANPALNQAAKVA